MAKYRTMLQEVLLQAAYRRRCEAERERRFYDSLEIAALAAFAAGYLIAVISHL
ncbi:MAG: hypothetical protein IKA69_06465 [Kiritimatiellae bacterium]|nr:hypothetical protein [Kiritimatiellia bacterium]